MSDPIATGQNVIGRVIFDGFRQGGDNALSGLIVMIVVATLALVLYARVLDRAHKGGVPLVSSRRSTMLIWNVVGPNAGTVMATTLVLATVAIALLLPQWFADRRRLETGHYAIVQGPITGLVVTRLSFGRRRALDTLAGQPPAPRETDELIVGGRCFLLTCTRPASDAAPVLGGNGACLDGVLGTRVEVDYVQLTPARYRAEPLRIMLLAP